MRRAPWPHTLGVKGARWGDRAEVFWIDSFAYELDPGSPEQHAEVRRSESWPELPNSFFEPGVQTKCGIHRVSDEPALGLRELGEQDLESLLARESEPQGSLAAIERPTSELDQPRRFEGSQRPSDRLLRNANVPRDRRNARPFLVRDDPHHLKLEGSHSQRLEDALEVLLKVCANSNQREEESPLLRSHISFISGHSQRLPDGSDMSPARNW